MSVSRTSKLFLTGAIGFGSVLTLAAPALADTPANTGTEMGIVLPAPQPEPGDIIVMPHPEPEAPKPIAQPEPKPEPKPADDLDIAQPQPNPEPQPQPQPDGPGEITDVPDCTHGCGPEGAPDDKAGPNQDPEVNPDLPQGPGELTDTEDGCQLTHGCPDENTTPEVDEDSDVDDDAEVLAETADRGALPRTGAGLALLAGIGTALTAVGAATGKLARR